MASERPHTSNREAELTVSALPFIVAGCEEPTPSEELLNAATSCWRDAATSAIARGEFRVIESGGWEAVTEPYALTCAMRAGDKWSFHVEATPAVRSRLWPEPADGATGSSVDAPAARDTLAVIGLLLGSAVAMWASSPFDVVLTFGQYSDGPWPSPDLLVQESQRGVIDPDETHAT